MQPLIRLVIPLLLLASACQPTSQPVEIEFTVRFGDTAIDCSNNDSEFALSDLRFYVADVHLLTPDGKAVPVQMLSRPPWQSEQVALIDLEDGEGECRNGSQQMNARIHGLVPADEYLGVEFTIGVPESLNHDDPLRALPPLTQTAMHWHWRSGYKFVRTGIRNSDDGIWLHLGSTRCEGVIGNLKGCAGSNRPRVRITPFDFGTELIALDLKTLFASAALDDGQVAGCEMGPEESLCNGILVSLGIDPVSGNSISSAAAFGKAARQ